MKKLSVFILSIIVCSALFAQQGGVIFREGTLSDALTQASRNKKGPKLVFLDCYTTWCGPCKNMTEKIFPQQKVGDFFNANFVNIKIDMEKGEGPELAKKYKIKAYPTFLILSPSGEEIGRVVGGGDAEGFIARIKTAMNPENSPQARLNTYMENKTFANAFAYMEALKESYKMDEVNDFINANFKSFQWYEKYSFKMWPFLSASLSRENSEIFTDVVPEITRAYGAFGRDKVNALLTQYIKRYIPAYIHGKIENATPAELRKRLEVLAFVNSSDALATILSDIAWCIVKDDYTPLKSIFQAHVVSALPFNDRPVVEKTVDALKDKIDPVILYNYYRSMAVSGKRSAEAYAEKAELFKPKTN